MEKNKIKIEAPRRGNPLRAIRHIDGFHKRTIANKKGPGSYQRQPKHKGRDW